VPFYEWQSELLRSPGPGWTQKSAGRGVWFTESKVCVTQTMQLNRDRAACAPEWSRRQVLEPIRRFHLSNNTFSILRQLSTAVSRLAAPISPASNHNSKAKTILAHNPPPPFPNLPVYLITLPSLPVAMSLAIGNLPNPTPPSPPLLSLSLFALKFDKLTPHTHYPWSSISISHISPSIGPGLPWAR